METQEIIYLVAFALVLRIVVRLIFRYTADKNKDKESWFHEAENYRNPILHSNIKGLINLWWGYKQDVKALFNDKIV